MTDAGALALSMLIVWSLFSGVGSGGSGCCCCCFHLNALEDREEEEEKKKKKEEEEEKYRERKTDWSLSAAAFMPLAGLRLFQSRATRATSSTLFIGSLVRFACGGRS